jgi:hypothetical protein
VIEHRKYQRFPLKLPVRILRAGSTMPGGSGETVNVSSGGVLFAADRRLEIGETIEYTIAFPARPGAPESTDLHCLGKVLRYEGAIANTERHVKVYIMAATIERHEFVRS